MFITKKYFFNITFSLLISANLSLLSSEKECEPSEEKYKLSEKDMCEQFELMEQQKKALKANPYGFKTMQNDFNKRLEECTNLYKDIKDFMPDKAKLILGIGTVGLGGVWIATQMTKSIILLGLCTGGIYITTSIGDSLLKDIDPKKVVPQIQNSLKIQFNETITKIDNIIMAFKNIQTTQNKKN